MGRIFRPNLIMHIEDDENWTDTLYISCCGNKKIRGLYELPPGEQIIQTTSTVSTELEENALKDEIRRLESETSDNPAYLAVVSGQVARTFLDANLPAAIISDTGFPMNGAQTVRWLIEHGLGDYPLIGLSGTPIEGLDADIRRFFLKTNARYFSKGEFGLGEQVLQQLDFNMRYTRENHHNF